MKLAPFRAAVVPFVAFTTVAACAQREPPPAASPPSPPSAPTTPAAAPSAHAVPLAPEACTITTALRPSCGACVNTRCCTPPVSFSPGAATALGCHIGCRKPLPGMPPQEPELRAAVVNACIDYCRGPKPSLDVERLDACIARECLPECLSAD